MLKIEKKAGDVLLRLKDNRKKHIAAYDEAYEAYIDKRIKLIRKGLKQLETTRKDKNLAHEHTAIYKPESYAKAYDWAIAMMDTAEADDIITLDESDFRKFWLDQWEWREQFAHAYTSNTGKAW